MGTKNQKPYDIWFFWVGIQIGWFSFCEETRKRCVEVGKNAKKVRKVGKLVLNAYVKSREVNPKALSFF